MAKEVDSYITKKKDMNFQSVEALQSVVNVVNEAAAALNVGTGNNLESLFTEEELKRNQQ